MKCPEYSLKVPASQLSVKRASDILNEFGKKRMQKTFYSVLCIISAFALLFSNNLLIMCEGMFGLGFSVKGLMENHKELRKFSEKEFVEMAKAK